MKSQREREAEYVQLMIHDPNSVHPADYSQNHAVSLTPLDLLGFVFAISSSMMFSQQPRFRNHVRDLPCKSHGYSNATVVAQRRQCWCQASSARVHDQLIYKWIHSPLNQGGVTELVQFGFAVWLMCSRYRWWNIVKPGVTINPKLIISYYFRHEITRPFFMQSSR